MCFENSPLSNLGGYLIMVRSAIGVECADLHDGGPAGLLLEDGPAHHLREGGDVIVHIEEMHVDLGLSRQVVFILHTDGEQVLAHTLVVQVPSQLDLSLLVFRHTQHESVQFVRLFRSSRHEFVEQVRFIGNVRSEN